MSRFSGRIKYYTEPPAAPLIHVAATLVAEMSKEFDIEGIDAMETDVIDSGRLPRVLPSETMKVQSERVTTELQQAEKPADVASMDTEDGEAKSEQSKSVVSVIFTSSIS